MNNELAKEMTVALSAVIDSITNAVKNESTGKEMFKCGKMAELLAELLANSDFTKRELALAFAKFFMHTYATDTVSRREKDDDLNEVAVNVEPEFCNRVVPEAQEITFKLMESCMARIEGDVGLTIEYPDGLSDNQQVEVLAHFICKLLKDERSGTTELAWFRTLAALYLHHEW